MLLYGEQALLDLLSDSVPSSHFLWDTVLTVAERTQVIVCLQSVLHRRLKRIVVDWLCHTSFHICSGCHLRVMSVHTDAMGWGTAEMSTTIARAYEIGTIIHDQCSDPRERWADMIDETVVFAW